jgi:hypothetical protein
MSSRWTRESTRAGSVYRLAGTELEVRARLSSSRVVGSALVFGQVVTEGMHRPRPELWELWDAGRMVSGHLKLAAAKAAAERRAAR